MATWTWTFEDADGAGCDPVVVPPAEGFGARADAETWVGEHWRALLAGGAEHAQLAEGGAPVAGPLALRPPA